MKKLFTLLLLAIVAVGAYAQERVIALDAAAVEWGAGKTVDCNYNYLGNDILRIASTQNSSGNYQLKVKSGDSQIFPTDGSSSYGKTKLAYQLTSENASALNTNALNLYGTGYTKFDKISVIKPADILKSGITLPFDETGDMTKGKELQFDIEKVSNLKVGDVIGLVLSPQSDAQVQFITKIGDGWTWTEFTLDNAQNESVYELEITNDNISKVTNLKEMFVRGKYVKILAVYLLTGETTYELSYANNNVPVSSLPNTAINVELARQFWSGWNSLCLPFNAAVSTIAADAELYEFTSATSESVTLTKKNSGEIVAGTPYLVKLSSNSSETTTFTNVSVTASTAGSTSYGGLAFNGNYEAGFDMTDKYGVVYTDNWYIMKGGQNATGKAFSAYFDGTVPTQAQTRGFSIITDDGTTKINTVEKVEEGDGEIYNLMGVRTSAPRKGIYIKNGKKYIVK